MTDPNTSSDDAHRAQLVASTASIVTAMIGASFIPASPNGITDAIKYVSVALKGIGDHTVAAPVDMQDGEPIEHVPAVSVRKSLASKDHIISMIDGKPYKTLRRHLAGHGLTPDSYRERYGLKPDYPMVAETYSQSRRDMAKRIGLGRKVKA